MNIRIELDLILEMLNDCVRTPSNVAISQRNEENDLEEDIGPLAAQVIMVDILAQQVLKYNPVKHQ